MNGPHRLFASGFLFGSLCLLWAAPAHATDYFVSTKGKNTNPGTLAQPWRTVQKAAETLAPGDTVFLRQGVYREKVAVKVSGSASGGWITFTAYAGEHPVVDAAGLKPSADGEDGIFRILDRDYIRVQGLELRNFATANRNLVPTGIFVGGGCDHIELRNNRTHHIQTRVKGGNAFGIAIYGTSAEKPITNLIIDGNQVDHCLLGLSESLSVNGNVTGFQVTNNEVHHNNNIGIVFIGYEGTCPDPALDRARDGLCRGNLVHHQSSYANPSYREFSAGGIYVDGGARVLIERNVSHHCDIGVELASEHKGRTTEGVILRENVIYQNNIGGIFVGGYDAQRGATKDCDIHHNTLVQNDTRQYGNGEFYLQHFVTGGHFTHNIVVAGKQKLLVGSPYQDSTNNVLDYNLYFTPSAASDAEWQWNGVSGLSLAAYRTASGQEAHTLFGDPQLVDGPEYDFHLREGSPAINAGTPGFTSTAGETDFDGTARVKGAGVDLGAFEF